MKRNLKQQNLQKWIISPKREPSFVEVTPSGPTRVSYGDTVSIEAHFTNNSDKQFTANWQKIENGVPRNLSLDSVTYCGSSCDITHLKLVINSTDHKDEGDYQIEVRSLTETIISQHVKVIVREDFSPSFSKNEINFLRIYVLCQNIGTKAVRKLFDKYVPKEHFSAHLKKNRTVLEKGDKNKHIQRCTTDQLQTLFQVSTEHAHNSSDFDLPLLCLLIRSTVTISHPTRGWGRKPLPEDTQETDDLERISQARNEIVHKNVHKFTDAEFDFYWHELSTAIDRLSKGLMKKDMDDLLKRLFYKYQKNEIIESIKQIKEIIRQQRDEIKQIESHVREIEDNRHIPRNIRESQEQQLASWRDEDKIFYYDTHVCKAGWELVKSKDIITFIGGPGSGKSATSRHLALRLEMEEGYELVPVFKPEQILEFVNINKKQVFLLDDVLGKLCMDKTLYSNIENYTAAFLYRIGRSSKIFFTCRKKVFNEAKRFKSFITKNSLDFQSKENMLTENDKFKMLNLHCINKQISEKDISNISLKSVDLMFPLLCKLYSNEIMYRERGETFFNQPIICVLDEIDKLQVASKIQYAALILCLVNDHELRIDALISQENKTDIYNHCGINRWTSDRAVIDALEEMLETYLKISDNAYTFMHDSIYEVVAYHYGIQFYDQILKYLPSHYVANKVKVCPQSSADVCQDLFAVDELTIVLEPSQYPRLAERLYRDIETLEMNDVFMNPALKTPPFLDEFIKVISAKSYDDFQSLFFSKQEKYEQIYRNSAKFATKAAGMCKVSDEQDERLHDKMRERIFELNRSKYSLFGPEDNAFRNVDSYIRVVWWLINSGHDVLLRHILDIVSFHNGSPVEELFQSDDLEQSRLLFFACFSNCKSMVDTILEYTDDQCIHRRYWIELRSKNPWMIARKVQYLPIHIASHIGNIDILNSLMKKNADINAEDGLGWTPLSYASAKGHYRVVQYLEKYGADLKHYNSEHEADNGPATSSLILASTYGHFEIVRFLIEKGVDFKLTCKGDRSALLQASVFGHTDIVQMLHEKGCDINKCDIRHDCPLTKAIRNKHFDVVKYLVENGVDVNRKVDEVLPPLNLAVKVGTFQISKFLIAHGANVNMPNDYGVSPKFIAEDCAMSPLLKAVYDDRLDLVELLLANGADPTASYLNWITFPKPMQLALWKNRIDIVQTIVKNETDRNILSGNKHLFDLLADINSPSMPFRHQKENTEALYAISMHNDAKKYFSGNYRADIDLLTCIQKRTHLNLKHFLNIGLNPNRWYDPLHDCSCNNCLKGKRSLIQILFDKSNFVEEREEKIVLLLEHGADINIPCIIHNRCIKPGKPVSLLEYARKQDLSHEKDSLIEHDMIDEDDDNDQWRIQRFGARGEIRVIYPTASGGPERTPDLLSKQDGVLLLASHVRRRSL